MSKLMSAASYEAWYHTPRGDWIGRTEAALLLDLMSPARGQTLLDVGCGTGYFSRRFADAGLKVTGIDPDPVMMRYAQVSTGAVNLVQAIAEQLPFSDDSFDQTTAVTSLCFVSDARTAVQELWRVSRQGMTLGLLNRASLLYRTKRDHGGYRGARWDTWPAARGWLTQLRPPPVRHRHRTGIFLPGGGFLARGVEQLLGGRLPWGGFLAVHVVKRVC